MSCLIDLPINLLDRTSNLKEMNIEEVLNDKGFKTKQKVEQLCNGLLDKNMKVSELLAYAERAKDVERANCIEALEHATKQKPQVANKSCFQFACRMLQHTAPRVKWESARVIGNTAYLFKENLEEAISNLLVNTEHKGMVIRWSAAYALGEIVKLRTQINKGLLPAIDSIVQREEQNSIKKIYLAAIKKIGK